MEKKGSIKAVAALFLRVALVGIFLSVGATSVTDVDAKTAAIVQGP